jgi:hypothetical protein
MRHLASTRKFDVDVPLFGTTTEFSPLSRPYFSAIGKTNVVRAFAGMHQYRVDVRGPNYHSMTPLHGVTAIENLAKVLPATLAGPGPATVMRATQFHEFAAQILGHPGVHGWRQRVRRSSRRLR